MCRADLRGVSCRHHSFFTFTHLTTKWSVEKKYSSSVISKKVFSACIFFLFVIYWWHLVTFIMFPRVKKSTSNKMAGTALYLPQRKKEEKNSCLRLEKRKRSHKPICSCKVEVRQGYFIPPSRNWPKVSPKGKIKKIYIKKKTKVCTKTKGLWSP